MPGKRGPVVSLAVLALAAGACGGESEGDRILAARGTTKPLAAEEKLVERRLVSEQDLAAARPGSVERAFLEYWVALSFEDWTSAVAYLDPRVRAAFEAPYLIAALKLEAANAVPVKPLVRDVARGRGDTVVRYFVRTAAGKLRPTSSAWRRSGGEWLMTYGSTLDDSYAEAVQAGVQAGIDPTAAAPSAEAVAAGDRARRAQAEALAP